MQQSRIAWPPLTDNVKYTLIGLAVLFVVSSFPSIYTYVDSYLLVSSDAVLEEYRVWTLLTYALFHEDFWHVGFNALVLWMFAGHLDNRWSTKRFWTHSVLCALGGGVAVVLTQWVLGFWLVGASTSTLGYSGAVMGFIAAFAWYNWNRRINFFLFPMKGKTMLLVLVGFDVFMVVFGGQAISISGHIGGMLTGLLLVTGYWRPTKLKQLWHRHKMKKKFKDASREVDRKRNGKWIN